MATARLMLITLAFLLRRSSEETGISYVLLVFVTGSLLFSGSAKPLAPREGQKQSLTVSSPNVGPQQRVDRLRPPQDDDEGSDFERWNWFYKQRAYPLADIPEGAKRRALQQLDRAKAELTPQTAASSFWSNIGPSPILGGQIFGSGSNVRVTGRIRDIDIDPTNPNHWLIASEGGGIWETRDSGTTWSPKTDFEISLSTGAVAFAPSNPSIIYAGVGFNSALGIGILKSTNGGASWQLLGAAIFSNVAYFSFREIKVHPTNPNIVLAASWSYFAGTPAIGIFKSTDGGVTWTQKLAGAATEFEVDPGDFNNMYAGIRTQWPDGNSSLNGVYRSTNSGDSWQLINGPWGAIPNGGSLIEFAIAPSNHNVLYVSFTNDQDGSHHLRTDNAWSPVPAWSNLPNNSGDFTNYQDSIVDPNNPDILYAGGFALLWKYSPGTGWTNVTFGMHVDEIAMAWLGNRLLVGNDGGMWSTTDGGVNWINHNTNLSVTQFYLGSLHPTNPTFALGGSQDNGTEKWTGSAWQFLFGGDGADNAISSSNPNTNWAISYQGLAILRTTDGGAGFSGADSTIDHTNAPFIGRFEKCPSNDNRFLAGTDNLWKTDNFFNSSNPTWSANSPEMRDGSGNPDSISAIAFASGNASCGAYAYGTGSGQLRFTTDSGATWRDIDPNNTVPNRYITDLAFSPFAQDTLYVSLSGFDEGTPGQPGHVFRTLNASSASPAWANISPPVNAPHNALAAGPSEGIGPPESVTLYVGTDVGVFKTTNDGATWTIAGTQLPGVPVLDLQLEIYGSARRLVAFTYGRGAFVLLRRKPRFDIDGDGTTDLGYYRNALWGILQSSQNFAYCCGRFFSWGGAGLQPIGGDFDGDGQTDIGYIVPPANGQSAAYAILKSSANYDFNQALIVPAGFPVLGDTPVAGDFDGDGKDDPGVWRSSQGVWIIPKSSTNYTAFLFSQWGQAGDTPIVADIDFDGRADFGFYRNGLWGFLRSSLNYDFCCPLFFSWGGAGLQPVVGDFDGDGRPDLAYMVPPSGGESAAYAILLSSTNYNLLEPLFVAAGFPVLGDTPVVGDFDGDGKDDPAIWRSSQGVWIIPRSSADYTTFIFSQWGQPGDIALPNSLIQR